MLDVILKSILENRIDESNLSRTDKFKVQFYKEKLNEEIYGGYITGYHQTEDVQRFIKSVTKSKIIFGSGNAYGKGFYLTSDLISQKNMLGNYGDTVVKCLFKPNGILFFDTENQIKVFKREMSLIEQCNYWGINLTTFQVKHITAIDNKMSQHTDDFTADYVTSIFDKIVGCVGLSFTQIQDGNVIVLFDTNNIKVSGYYPIIFTDNDVELGNFKPIDIVHYRDEQVISTPSNTLKSDNKLTTDADFEYYNKLYKKINLFLGYKLLNLFLYATIDTDDLYNFVNENNNGLHYKMKHGDLIWVLNILKKYGDYNKDYQIFGGYSDSNNLVRELNKRNIVLSTGFSQYFPYKITSEDKQVDYIKSINKKVDINSINYITNGYDKLSDVILSKTKDSNNKIIEYCVKQLNKIIKSKNRKIDKSDLNYIRDGYDLLEFLISVDDSVKNIIEVIPDDVDIEKITPDVLKTILLQVEKTNPTVRFKFLD